MSLAEILDYTYEDYERWEGAWELIDGYPVAMAPASVRKHQNIAAKIVTVLTNVVEDAACDDCVVSFENDWKINDTTVVRPDIILTCGDEGEKYLTKAPQIVIEIVSPSTAKLDERIKYHLYEAEKVPYYIQVYPEDLKAKVYRLENGKFSKVGDFTKETMRFNGLDCEVELDFAEVFRKFRKSGA
ncbi:Uma2 family endonuclease [Hydrogenimonas sp. SS33]|uniref:Uma2 family endonuclease n=1 Tax=Hydrogenimonas leucolamina TaxID=2954236 RepID=UPI00336C139E